MGSTAMEKTEDELRREIDELQRQQREVLSLPLYFSFCISFYVCVRFLVWCYICLKFCRLRSGFEILEGFAEVGCQVLALATSLLMGLVNGALCDLYVISLHLFLLFCVFGWKGFLEYVIIYCSWIIAMYFYFSELEASLWDIFSAVLVKEK